ncbi:unnamed protein product [Mytilus coruscus]|uniref:Uncharacterized protein n=1 Tax=Mytilus coruscus TaxID=42192 RepID=A0A6J8E589_MYTCO|nr:unnamed protein product [Mytilus coruscus]
MERYASFYRPATFKIQIGQIGSVIEDDWLIQRLIKRLTGHESFRHGRLGIESTSGVKEYTEKYGCEQFVKKFNSKLKELFQYEEHVVYCECKVIHHFIRPATFEIKSGQIGTVINDGWLIRRLIKRLAEPGSFEPRVDSTWGVKGYIETYGCKQFDNKFNIQLMKWFQSERKIIICEWEVVHHFIRPTLSQTETNRVDTATIDGLYGLLVQKLLKILVNQEPFSRIDDISWQVKDYLAKYWCEKFVNDFNKKLTEWFLSEENVVNCRWDIILHFILLVKQE